MHNRRWASEVEAEDGRTERSRDAQAGRSDVVDTMVEASAKVWYLAAGEKKVGPLAAARVIERVAEGKVPAQARAWREGMDEWLPISAIEELRAATAATALEDPPARRRKATTASGAGADELGPGGEQASPVQAGTITNRRPRPGAKTRVVGARAAVAQAAAAPFEARWRLERGDVWRAFGMGLEGGRVRLALASALIALVALALGAGVAFVAGLLHPLLAVPVLGLATFAAGVVVSVGRGALAFDARRRLEEQAPPSVGDALAHAWRRAPALVLPPIALGVLWPLPLVAIVVLAVCVRIPYLGPVGTGLLFGVHIALSALAALLVLATATSQAFTAHVVVFEDVGALGALRALVAFTRRALGRVVVWSVLPGLAFGPFALLVLTAVTAVVAVPVAATGAMVAPAVLAASRGPDLDLGLDAPTLDDAAGGRAVDLGEAETGGEAAPSAADLEPASADPLAAVPGLRLGLVPLLLWCAVALAAGCAALASVSNALGALLYVGAREGNDALPSRDALLSRQASPGAV